MQSSRACHGGRRFWWSIFLLPPESGINVAYQKTGQGDHRHGEWGDYSYHTPQTHCGFWRPQVIDSRRTCRTLLEVGTFQKHIMCLCWVFMVSVCFQSIVQSATLLPFFCFGVRSSQPSQLVNMTRGEISSSACMVTRVISLTTRPVFSGNGREFLWIHFYFLLVGWCRC